MEKAQEQQSTEISALKASRDECIATNNTLSLDLDESRKKCESLEVESKKL